MYANLHPKPKADRETLNPKPSNPKPKAKKRFMLGRGSFVNVVLRIQIHACNNGPQNPVVIYLGPHIGEREKCEVFKVSDHKASALSKP